MLLLLQRSYPLCWSVQGLHGRKGPWPGQAPLTSLPPSTHHPVLAPKSGKPPGNRCLSVCLSVFDKPGCSASLTASEFHSKACWTYRTPSPAASCNQTAGPKSCIPWCLHSGSPIRGSDKRSVEANVDESMGHRLRVQEGLPCCRHPDDVPSSPLLDGPCHRASAHLCTPSASQKCRLQSARPRATAEVENINVSSFTGTL